MPVYVIAVNQIVYYVVTAPDEKEAVRRILGEGEHGRLIKTETVAGYAVAASTDIQEIAYDSTGEGIEL